MSAHAEINALQEEVGRAFRDLAIDGEVSSEKVTTWQMSVEFAGKSWTPDAEIRLLRRFGHDARLLLVQPESAATLISLNPATPSPPPTPSSSTEGVQSSPAPPVSSPVSSPASTAWSLSDCPSDCQSDEEDMDAEGNCKWAPGAAEAPKAAAPPANEMGEKKGLIRTPVKPAANEAGKEGEVRELIRRATLEVSLLQKQLSELRAQLIAAERPFPAAWTTKYTVTARLSGRRPIIEAELSPPPPVSPLGSYVFTATWQNVGYSCNNACTLRLPLQEHEDTVFCDSPGPPKQFLFTLKLNVPGHCSRSISIALLKFE